MKATLKATLVPCALRLNKAVFIKPDESTRYLNAGRQRVKVTRVEFEDSGVWKAP